MLNKSASVWRSRYDSVRRTDRVQLTTPMSDTDRADQHASSRRSFISVTDLIVTLVLIAFCLWLYRVTAGFDEASALLGQNVLPEEFPRLLLWIIGGLALLLPFEHRLQPDRWRKIDATRKKPISKRTWISIGFILAIVLAAPHLGTVLTMATICFTLPVLWGERRWLMIIIFTLIFTGLVTWLFNGVLRVYFEAGLLGLFTG